MAIFLKVEKSLIKKALDSSGMLLFAMLIIENSWNNEFQQPATLLTK